VASLPKSDAGNWKLEAGYWKPHVIAVYHLQSADYPLSDVLVKAEVDALWRRVYNITRNTVRAREVAAGKVRLD
jgi:hypothetical protein